MAPAGDARRRVPSVDALLRTPAAVEASRSFGRAVVRQAIRETLDDAREEAARGRAVPMDTGLMAIAARRAARAYLGIGPVVNATGVLLHTGLGRAPLAEDAVKAVARVARGYADLEVDRDTGTRGRRTIHAEYLLRALTGAEDALVVNNNAAALLLTLAALARGKQVVVSRGELIEIGGEFRLPDIMAASGAKLVEVGTTNRTRKADYARAITERTALVLKVHPSNYRVSGFAESVPVGVLAELAHARGVALVHDLGSGLLSRGWAIPEDEPAADESLAAGADLVCFSGDKLLGGPQAGILLGGAGPIAKLRKHPMARALRVDVMTVAALEATLRVYASGDPSSIPLWRSIAVTKRALRSRARAVAAALDGTGATVADTETSPGGGSLPGHLIASAGVRLPADHPQRLADRLRAGRPPVFCRVEEDALVFDLRAVDPSDDATLTRAIAYALLV